MLTHRIDATRGIVYVEGIQESADDVRAMFTGVVADPAYRPGFAFLRDRRGMPPLETAVLRQGVAILGALLRGVPTRWAIVASDEGNFGMGRMAAFLAEEYEGEVAAFRDLEAAIAWLVERPSRRSLTEA